MKLDIWEVRWSLLLLWNLLWCMNLHIAALILKGSRVRGCLFVFCEIALLTGLMLACYQLMLQHAQRSCLLTCFPGNGVEDFDDPAEQQLSGLLLIWLTLFGVIRHSFLGVCRREGFEADAAWPGLINAGFSLKLIVWSGVSPHQRGSNWMCESSPAVPVSNVCLWSGHLLTWLLGSLPIIWKILGPSPLWTYADIWRLSQVINMKQ